MRLFYDGGSGEIVCACYDNDLPRLPINFTTTKTLSTLDIDEVTANLPIAAQVSEGVGRKDAQGNGPYYIAAGVVMQRIPWTEVVIPNG